MATPDTPPITSSEAKPSPSVARVPWNSALGVVFILAVFFASQIIAGLLLSVYPALHHWTLKHSTDWLSNSINAQFGYILLAESFSVGSIYYFLRHYKVRWPIIGLRRPRWSDLGYGLSAVLPYYVLYILTVGVVSHFVPSLNVNQQQDVGFNNVTGVLPLVLTFISLVVLPPIAEELMVRGVLYSSLKKSLPMVSAVVVTSLVFAAAHLPEGGAAGPLYIAALDTFVLSLVLIYLREKTGGLYSSMVLHAIKNGIAFYALYILHSH